MPRKKRKKHTIIIKRMDERLTTFITYGVKVTVKTPESNRGTMHYRIICTAGKESKFKTITLNYDEAIQLKACLDEAMILLENRTS